MVTVLAPIVLGSLWVQTTPPPVVKKPLDHSVYDSWNSIRGSSLSDDGNWLLYTIAPQEGDGTTFIRSVKDGHIISIPRGAGLQFSHDNKFIVGLVTPTAAELKKARRDKVKPDDMPKSSLIIVELASGNKTTIEKVSNVSLPEEDSGWIVYKVEPPKPAAPAKPAETKPVEPAETKPVEPAKTEAVKAEVPKAEATKQEEKKPEPPKKKADHKAGDTYVLRQLTTGKEEKLENVVSLKFNKSGTILVSALSTKDGSGDGIEEYFVGTGKKTTVVKAMGHYPRFDFTKDGKYIAYTTDKDDYAAKKPTFKLYLYDGKAEAKVVGADSLPKDWVVPESSSVSFTENEKRLIYTTAPKPKPDPEEKPDDEKVSVDIWNYKDPVLMPAQLLRVAADRNRSYMAMYDMKSGKSKQLANESMKYVSISDRSEGKFALYVDSDPYAIESAWDPGIEDLYIVNVETGEKKQIFKRVKGSYSLSNTGKYTLAFLGEEKSCKLIDNESGKITPVTLPYPLFDEEDDHPDVPGAYGLVGWTKDDSGFVIKDAYDEWLVDSTGRKASVNLTKGREAGLHFTRTAVVSKDEPGVDLDDVYYTVLKEDDKQGGIYHKKDGKMSKVFLAEKLFAGLRKAKNADTFIYTQSDFVEYPDIWLTNTSFNSPQKVTDTNPQQKNYNWGKAELVSWTSLDGVKLQGILIKPEDFDYSKKYPMITYFYEKNSDQLYRYYAPSPSASTINFPLFASNGYCIFIPDIPYKIGYPGNSALSAIVPGVLNIVNRGYVDPKRLGIQGQSWGGYQTAFLVTQTDMFAAAEAGAPVTNMFSAYGGIRYGSGLVRQMQYEHQQSRIGGTPWDATLKYIENSPQFWLDRVKTPLMIMSNDKDGAVPHTQGIELFTGLRRLGKPSWLVVYNGEDHNLMERKNRKDLSVRLSQFFDHYLKGAPMPKWMADGVPATEKGRTMGLELVNKN